MSNQQATQKEKAITDAPWKQVYTDLFRCTPRSKRKTKHQIKTLRSAAKIVVYMLYQ